MKSITTAYHGPTNYRGSRIKATDGDNAVYVSYRSELNGDENHREAALALAKKLKWGGVMVQGETKDGYVFVFLPRQLEVTALAIRSENPEILDLEGEVK